MERLALYREWRPQVFRDVIGQEHVSRTLKNAVSLGRIAHAYLFCGPRGTGKTSTARILARALNCPDPQDGEPCNRCPSCRSITDGMSLNVIEMDAASHRGIEEIRDLRQKVGMAPSGGRYKVYIIDEVHMLTGEAFNALLKTLEEPPAHAVFILATTESQKIPLTILSRCQRFDFRRLDRTLIKDHLTRIAREKGWDAEDAALELISRQAGGALRDALGLLDQAASFAEGRIRLQDIEMLTGAPGKEVLDGIIAAVAGGDVPALMERLDTLFARGYEPRQALLQLADHLRDLLFEQRTGVSERRLYARLLRGIAGAEVEMRGSARPDLILELALLRVADAVSAPGEGHPLHEGRGKTAAGKQPEGGTAGGKPPVSGGRGQDGQPQEMRAEKDAGPGKPDPAAGSEGRERGPRTSRAAPEGAAVGREKPAGAAGSGTFRRVGATTGKSDSCNRQENREQAGDAVHPEDEFRVEGGHRQGRSPEEQPQERPNRTGGETEVPDLAAIRNILTSSAGNHSLLSRVLPECELTLEGNTLVLAAPPFYCDIIKQKEESRRVLCDALRECGCSLELALVPRGGAPVPERENREEEKVTPQKQPEAESPVTRWASGEVQDLPDDDPVSLALTLFDGRIIKRIEEGD